MPAGHGGFETFAEKLALYLVGEGWRVTVYCQADDEGRGDRPDPVVDAWYGVERVTFHTSAAGPRGTMEFDWAAIQDARHRPGVVLILGYNTAAFALPLRLDGRFIFINMDGVEWKRSKWSLPAKLWLLLNEMAATRLATGLIADHPLIAQHVERRRPHGTVTMIPYGGDRPESPDPGLLRQYGLVPDEYFISIARIEPENSILELVQAYSMSPRRLKLFCLGRLDLSNPYHARISSFAGPNVIFPGPIYDKPSLASLRTFARAYCHGHTVGGTNPSLVEAMASGSAVLAHYNGFNRWVAGPDQFFFATTNNYAEKLSLLERDDDAVDRARQASKRRFEENFQWEPILKRYEFLLRQGSRCG